VAREPTAKLRGSRREIHAEERGAPSEVALDVIGPVCHRSPAARTSVAPGELGLGMAGHPHQVWPVAHCWGSDGALEPPRRTLTGETVPIGGAPRGPDPPGAPLPRPPHQRAAMQGMGHRRRLRLPRAVEAQINRAAAAALERYGRHWREWQAKRLATTSVMLGIPVQDVQPVDIGCCRSIYGVPDGPESEPGCAWTGATAPARSASRAPGDPARRGLPVRGRHRQSQSQRQHRGLREDRASAHGGRQPVRAG
jgi:hypothetical protein